MNLEKFVQKEERSSEEVEIPAKARIERWVVEENGRSFLAGTADKIQLPITQINNVSETQVGSQLVCFNNNRIAVIYNAELEMVKFFRLPLIRPDSLVYYGNSLFAAISASGEEIVSFKVGGPGADSEFLIGKYAVCFRASNPQRLWSTAEGIWVSHAKGATLLKPI